VSALTGMLDGKPDVSMPILMLEARAARPSPIMLPMPLALPPSADTMLSPAVVPAPATFWGTASNTVLNWPTPVVSVENVVARLLLAELTEAERAYAISRTREKDRDDLAALLEAAKISAAEAFFRLHARR